jgi:hypothetical protein
MTPRNPFGVKNAVISVLAGDFYRGGALAWRLRVFRTIFAVSRLLNPDADKRLGERLQNLPSVSMPETKGPGNRRSNRRSSPNEADKSAGADCLPVGRLASFPFLSCRVINKQIKKITNGQKTCDFSREA